MSAANDGFLDDLFNFARDAAPYIAIAGLVAATGGTGAVAGGAASVSRFAAVNAARRGLVTASTQGGVSAYFANATLRLNGPNFARASWTIYKRILGTNLLRAATDKEFDLQDAAINSFQVSSWITESILLSSTSKSLTQPLKNAIMSQFPRTGNLGNMRASLQGKLTSHVDSLRAMEKARQMYPGLDFATGDINGRRTFQSTLNDISRKSQLSILSPQSSKEQFVGGFFRGASNQFIGTQVFRTLVGRSSLSRASWATSYVQNLDELYLPTTTANTAFQNAYLALRSFDVATVRRNSLGSYSRLNRMQLFKDTKASIGHADRMMKLAQNTFTPEGLGKLSGNLAMRQLLIATGEDERMQEAYKRANAKGSNKSGGTITVSGYYRDGHYVSPHTRDARG